MNSDPGEWTIITVTYNSAADLKFWWDRSTTRKLNWIVVDNCSVDDTVEIARELGATVYQMPKNAGFSKANNVGLAHAGTKFTAFVNPDVQVVADEFERLGEMCVAHNALVSPQLIHPSGQVQPNGRGLPFLVDKIANRGIKLPGSRLREYIPDTNQGPTFVPWAIGAVVCGPTAYFKKCGGWDEDFFLYYEDHAMGLNAWRNGLAVIVDPTCRWVHGWHRETKNFRLKPWARELSSALTFYRKWPQLIFPTRSLARKAFGPMAQKFGKTIDDSQAKV